MADIEEHIRQAIQAGKFKDLRGQGKPLRLEDDVHEDPEWRLAYHMLRESGYTLPWIDLRNEIERNLAQSREELHRAWQSRQDRLSQGESPGILEAEWRRALNRFASQVEDLNKRIFDYNLQTPNPHLQRLKINLEREVDAVKASARTN